MLEGKEVEGKIGHEGGYSVDVTPDGQVVLELTYEKIMGAAKVKTANMIELSLMSLLEQVAKKTSNTWDDAVVAQIKQMIGLK